MSPELVLIGEVKVNIRRFIAVESEEGLKRDIVSVTVHIRTAVRTVLRRQVKARAVFAVQQKFAVFALGAHIMWRKRIYLGDTCH